MPLFVSICQLLLRTFKNLINLRHRHQTIPLSLPRRCRARNLQHTLDEFNQRSAGVLSLNCFRIGSDALQLTVGLVSGAKIDETETNL